MRQEVLNVDLHSRAREGDSEVIKHLRVQRAKLTHALALRVSGRWCLDQVGSHPSQSERRLRMKACLNKNNKQ